jgi:hypothetical protein
MAVMCKGEPIRQNEYVAASEIKNGDFLTLNSDGHVAVATATQALCGVANSYASAQGAVVKVWDHPDQMFIVPTSSANPDVQTEYNLNYNIVANTTTSQDGNHTLDSASGDTTATLPLKALMPMPLVGRSNGSAAAPVVCVINNHQLKGGTGTAGI